MEIDPEYHGNLYDIFPLIFIFASGHALSAQNSLEIYIEYHGNLYMKWVFKMASNYVFKVRFSELEKCCPRRC